MIRRTNLLIGLLADLIASFMSAVLASQVLPFVETLARADERSPGLWETLPIVMACFPFLAALLFLADLYAVPRHWGPLQTLRALVLIFVIAAILFVMASVVVPAYLGPPRRMVLSAGVIALLLMFWLRARWPELYGRTERKRRILLVGAHTYAVRAIKRFAKEHPDEIELIGILDDFKGPTYFENLEMEYLGSQTALTHVLETRKVDTVFVLNDHWEYSGGVIDAMQQHPQVEELYVRAEIPLFMAQDIEILFIREVPLLKVYNRSQLVRTVVWRNLMDKALALIGLVLSSPFFALVPILIKLNSPGPVFYRQKRLGLHNAPFWIWKFRSMVVDAEKRTGAVLAQSNDPRITRVGVFLRATRLDELPQLFNVLRGEMSIIGPRPERPEFQNAYLETIPWYPLRSLCKPGVTGLAQVNGDYHTSAQRKLLYDVSYLANMSVLLNLRILLATVVTVLTKQGH